MIDTPLTMTSKIALSLQCGLLDRIFPNIRAIGFGYQDKLINIYCIVDGEPSTLLIDEVECAATEVISDFPSGFRIGTHIERIDSPKRFDGKNPRISRWVYSRYEEN